MAADWTAATVLAEHSDTVRAWREQGTGHRRAANLLHEQTGRFCSRHVMHKVFRRLDGAPNRANGTEAAQVAAEDTPPKADLTIDATGTSLTIKSTSERVRSLEDLLRAANVDTSKYSVEKWTANQWEGFARTDDGVVVVPLWQVKAHLERSPAASLKPVTPVRHLEREVPPVRGGLKTALIIPDSQNGYLWNKRRTKLDPMHDRKAWDVAVQTAAFLQPDEIVLLGDMADFAELSTKYPRPPELQFTTQPTLDELHWWLGQLRLAAPAARIVFLEGNHEERMQRILVEKAAPLAGLSPVGEDEPAMSMPRLLGLDALGVEYVGPYGASYWLWDRVEVTHGEWLGSKVGQAGSRALADLDHSVVFGHVHNYEYVPRTVSSRRGPKTVYAMSPGCLCRIDGAVPGVKKRVNWQQGLGLVTVDPESSHEHLSIVPIRDGRAVVHGKLVVGRDRGQDIVADTGYAPFA